MKLMESSLVLLNCVEIAWSSGVLKEIRLLSQRMKTIKAATYIVATLVCALLTVSATAADRPNIIVMMVDDMGFAGPSIAPYGNPHYKTPGMDRLASEGMLFTDFYASGAICSATRAGLLTGRYQQRAGIEAVIHPHATHPEHRKGLHEDEVTFAELFKDAGYSTGLVGKWHLGYAAETPKYHPMNHGFDYFMGYVSGNIDYINHWGDHMQHDWWHGRKETKEEGYTTHLINKYALEFIEQNKDKPFCLYIAHESPHSPVQGPDDPSQRGPGAKKRTTPHAEAMKQMILEMDKGVEQVRSRLVKLGLEKNTLFLFFSDNGDAPGTATGSPRFRGHKGSVYEGGTRVPAVAWWPGRIKAGTQAEDLSITLDVMPTILSVAGIASTRERTLDGVDLSPVIFEQKTLPLRPLFWANLNNNGSRFEALRDGPWKLVVQHPKAKPGTFENETIELFNLDDDEGEQANLATEQPERAATMLKRIKAWYANTQATASPQPGGWLNAAVAKGQSKTQLQNQQTADRPNILFICTDDQAPWAMGASGNRQAVTPHMDALAAQSAYLQNAFVTTPVCSPSRAATLTGRYGYEVGVFNWFKPGDQQNGLDLDETTFAEALRTAGYRTGLVGKWHLGMNDRYYPTRQGFDYFMGHRHGGFATVNPDLEEQGEKKKYKGLTADVLGDHVVKYLSKHVTEHADKPFLLCWHTRAPHTRWLPVAPEDMKPYAGDAKIDIPTYPDLDEDRVNRMMREYLASVRSVDRNLGRVMKSLDDLELSENTVVIFTSDHGYNMGHHGIWHKGNGNWILKHDVPASKNTAKNNRPNMFDNSVRVPSLVRWPGVTKPGSKLPQMTTNLDWYPTLLEIAGTQVPDGKVLRGRSLAPLLQGEDPADWPKDVYGFYSSSKEYASQFVEEMRMMRTTRWKLVRFLRTPEKDELYDLTNDPEETKNVFAAPKNKDIIAQLHAELIRRMRETNDPALTLVAGHAAGGQSQPSTASVPQSTSRENPAFFNGKELTGWKGGDGYWSVKDGAIVGHSEKDVPRNEFIWSDVEVKDFYLAVDVKLTPDARNAGIQFRSKPINAHGQAIGYQADVGAGVWGKLYHEHGRGKLDWNDNAAGAVKPGQWNRYEILADGHRIWTAINGKLCVAIEDPKGELSGKIAFQIHGGPPQTVHYRSPILTHNPKIELAGLNEKELLAKLPQKQSPKKELPYWSRLIAGADPGSQDEAWAKPTFDHSKWKTMKVPGHFDTVELPGFDGVVWFRKTVEVSVEQARAAATLHVGQVDDMDVTWVNGTRVGGFETPGHHFTVRKYPVPAGVLKPGKNVIAVRVMDHGAPGGIAGKPEQLFLQLNEERISLANRWHFAPGANLAALNKYNQVPALLRPLARPKTPVPAFADGFAINSDQTIVILGSTNALENGRHGYLETLLTAAHPQHRVRLRKLAWQADTVYVQQRPRNFYAPNKPNYGERDGRRQINADIVFFWMGQSESLDGPQRVDEFKAAYLMHLDQISDYTKRIVLVTPVPFSNPLRLEIDIQKRNKSLAVYVDAIRQIGRNRKLPVVDLFRSLTLRVEQPANKLDSESQATFSRNGLHLSRDGHWDAAQAIAAQLGFADRVASIKRFDSVGPLEPPSAEKLRQAIVKKNDLWFRYWRPTNWAFLYGNRQTQPSSRDHKNPGRRWFPEELQDALPHLDEAEQRIHEAAKAASR
jgi:arylsulfatase A-like enzyme